MDIQSSNPFKRTGSTSISEGQLTDERAGWYFNALSWNLVVRPLASLTAGILFAVVIKTIEFLVVQLLSLTSSPIGWLECGLLAALFTALFAMEDTKDETVLVVKPTKFAVQVAWLGIPLGIYLKSSIYSWRGTKLRFSTISKVSEPFTDENGLLKMDTIPFPVWNSPDAEMKSRDRTYMSAPAKNNAEISGALTLILRIFNPQKVLDTDDPARNLGDKARQEFRELVTKFVDTDVPKLHSSLKYLLEGNPMYTCFIGKALPGVKIGSMVRDKSGFPVFETLRGKDDSEEKAVERLTKRIYDSEQMDEDMCNAVKIKGGSVRVYEIRVDNPINDVLKEIGCRLDGVRFADIEFSDAVKQAAERASAEEDENISQLFSAETMKMVRKKLMPTEDEVNNPGYELATVIAAAQDDKNGNIRIVMTPGGNKLTSAAVAGASEIGGKK
ncbi:hypothetical protein KC851_00290 [Candidatus Kaiserbacteria bacterium]|nr:hypothetical protein [Candidatus Kaiserbacteria bacterium]